MKSSFVFTGMMRRWLGLLLLWGLVFSSVTSVWCAPALARRIVYHYFAYKHGAPMSFRLARLSDAKCEPNCPQWIAADGEFAENTADKFAGFLFTPGMRDLPVVFNSNGGSIKGAVLVGIYLRIHHMNAAVGRTIYKGCTPSEAKNSNCKPAPKTGAYPASLVSDGAHCLSACPLALLGGERRYAGATDKIGLHTPSTEAAPDKKSYGHKRIVANFPEKMRTWIQKYANTMGANGSGLVAEMEKATPYSMNYIPADDGSHTNKRFWLGLVTDASRSLDKVVGLELCASRVPAKNCGDHVDHSHDGPGVEKQK